MRFVFLQIIVAGLLCSMIGQGLGRTVGKLADNVTSPLVESMQSVTEALR